MKLFWSTVVLIDELLYLFLTVGTEGQQGHGAVGGTAAWAGGHPVFRGLAGALEAAGLAASFTPQAGG